MCVPSGGKIKIKGFVHRMDWEWKCDSEYVRIRKQMHHCRRRNQASVVAAYIMGWCKVEDTVSLILIESACAIKKLKYWKRNLKPNYSALQSYWEFLHRARMDRKNNDHLHLLTWLTFTWIQIQLSSGPACVRTRTAILRSEFEL